MNSDFMSKNIIILIEHLNGGGAERVAAELSMSLEKKGHKVCLVCFEDLGTTYQHCTDLICINLPGSNSYIQKIKTLCKRIQVVKRIKRDRQIDVSISFMDNANLVNVLSKDKDKTICSIRTVLSTVSGSSILRKVQKIVLCRANTIVTLSEYVRQDLIQNYQLDGNKICTVYNPCPLSIQNPSSVGHPLFTIVTAGRFVEAKGQWHLIRSFAEFNRRHPDSILRIMGKGPLEGKLKQLASDLDVSENVEFIGFVHSPEEQYIQADVFAFSSLWEGFGNAIVEAMACGLPIICADCPGGPHEILDEAVDSASGTSGIKLAKYGILHQPFPEHDYEMNANMPLSESEQALLEGLDLLYENSDLRKQLSDKAIKRAESFDREKITSEWESLF